MIEEPWLIALQPQTEEMRRAGNARIIVAYCLLTLPGDLLLRTSRNRTDKLTQVILYSFLIL